MYKNILLAYDGSIEGAQALREGALMARRCSSRVFLLSVVPETAGVILADGSVAGGEQIDDYKDLLDRGVARLKRLGFDPVARLVEGEPTSTIAAVAREISADLVVVGHRTKHTLSRWWAGSGKDYLSDHVGCSLLIACNPMSDEAFDAAVMALETA
jgi:nucleotide-binding universal stress UspA family protein